MPDEDKTCSYGHTAKNKGLEADDDIINYVCDLLAQRYHKGQIKAKIREEIAADISLPALEALITAAKQRIKDRYQLDAKEYRGYLVAELERLLRAKTPTKYRLKVIHELADLLGLKQIADVEAPEAYAEKIREAMRAADASVDGTAGLPSYAKEDKDAFNKQNNETSQAEQEEQKATQKTS